MAIKSNDTVDAASMGNAPKSRPNLYSSTGNKNREDEVANPAREYINFDLGPSRCMASASPNVTKAKIEGPIRNVI